MTYSGHSLEEFYLSSEMQSVNSTASDDWVWFNLSLLKEQCLLLPAPGYTPEIRLICNKH